MDIVPRVVQQIALHVGAVPAAIDPIRHHFHLAHLILARDTPVVAAVAAEVSVLTAASRVGRHQDPL
jgi:hypothetical protein